MLSSDSIPLQETASSPRADSPIAPETFSKEEAAQFLGVSSRALERYTASGRLAVGYAKGKTRSVAVYERVELERLKAELGRPLLRGASSAANSGASSDSNPIFPVGQTPTTATPPTQGANLGVEQGKVWGGRTIGGTSPNPDSPLDPVSDELVAVSPGSSGGAENALDALTQLVLERLLERLHGEAAVATSPDSSTASASGSALVLASATPHAPKAPLASPGEKLLLTLPEAAALTGLSRAFLKNAISDGALVAKPIGRLWRVKRADLDVFVAAL